MRSEKIVLDSFTMSYDGYPDIKVGIPCSLIDTLYKNKYTDDPYYRDNASKLVEFPDHECIFSTEFDAGEEFAGRKNIRLVCYGLDTLCHVYVNDCEVGYADNMHRIWKFDIRRQIRTGKNRIEFRFQPPVKYMKARQDRHYAWGDTHAIDGIAQIRKSSYMFGWDWAPKLPDTGIFRSVEIQAYDLPVISETEIHQDHSDGRVSLKIRSRVEGELPDNCCFTASVISPDGAFSEEYRSVSGDFEVNIENPQLWWPNGYGEHSLYTVCIKLMLGDETVDTDTKRIGLRTIGVSRRRDKWGREFCFEVNGVRIFAMGADYIPEDNILPRISAERSERLIKSCADANFNCIRIWGGGYYPPDEFYDICDRYGIIIWQDFMFACLNVWMSSDFERNVTEEIKDVLLRIRHHASIGLLCGNNEMEYAVCEWKIPKDELVRSDYLKLYERIMPDMCEKYAPQIFYWPSSPSCGGGFDNPNNENDGDSHYWEVWLRNAPVESYREHYFRFCSEFGFESFPDIRTVRSYTGTEYENPLSYIIEFHQKREQASEKLVTYAAANFLYPSGMENFIYCTQLVQGEAIQYAVEHMRRFRGRCMGAIYWQLNDSWPGQTWSSIDYFGRWKPLHYFAKRFFAPQLISAHRDDSVLVINVSNEAPIPFVGKVRIRSCGNDMVTVRKEEKDIRVDALSSLDVLSVDTGEWLGDDEKRRYIEYTLFDNSGKIISQRSYLGTKNKFYHFDDPAIRYEAIQTENGCVLNLTCVRFARYVDISSSKFDIICDTNDFDMTESHVYTVEVNCPEKPDYNEFLTSLKIRSVYDIDK